MAPNAAHIVDFSEPAAPPAPAPTYEELLLAAARTLGREPSAQRIAEKAGLPLGKAGVIDQVNAAFHELISRGDLIPGTRGGLRLPERC